MLTPEQQAILKAAIIANPTWNSQPDHSDGAYEIANMINAKASPDFYVWKTSVGVDEIMSNGFDWSRVDNLSVSKARIWEWMTALGSINPSKPNVRAGINACFSAALDSGNRSAVYGHCQRFASIIEKMLADGAGTASTDQGVGPATMGFEGPIYYQDILDARALP